MHLLLASYDGVSKVISGKLEEEGLTSDTRDIHVNLTFPDICGEEIHRLVFVLAFDMIYRFAHRLRVRGD
jgi:hypothetical protein